MGYATTRTEERVAASLGSLPTAPIEFRAGQDVAGGGVLLAVGLASRPVALLFVVDMLVAYITADRASFFSFFSNPDKFVGAAPCTFLCASLLILIFGPGRFSLDALADRWFTGRTAG